MKITSIIALLILLCASAYLYSACKPAWQFDHLEQNARKVVSAAELQAWATNFLAQYPSNATPRLSQLGTNFPEPLLSLAPKLGPGIVVFDGKDTHSPPWVRVVWGSGFLGAAGFEIGPTNFAGCDPKRHAWQPGVYFYRR